VVVLDKTLYSFSFMCLSANSDFLKKLKKSTGDAVIAECWGDSKNTSAPSCNMTGSVGHLMLKGRLPFNVESNFVLPCQVHSTS